MWTAGHMNIAILNAYCGQLLVACPSLLPSGSFHWLRSAGGLKLTCAVSLPRDSWVLKHMGLGWNQYAWGFYWEVCVCLINHTNFLIWHQARQPEKFKHINKYLWFGEENFDNNLRRPRDDCLSAIVRKDVIWNFWLPGWLFQPTAWSEVLCTITKAVIQL